MFQDNPYCRPLYDTLEGGSPKAWKCLMCPDVKVENANEGLTIKVCHAKVTRTLAGMKQHLKRVHGWTMQPKLNLGS